MSSTEAQAPARPSSVSGLAHDHVVQLAAWLVAVEIAILAVPLVDPGVLAALGASRVEVPFAAAAALAAFYTLRRVDNRDELRFWRLLGAGCLVWFATVSLAATIPGDGASMARAVMIAAGHLGFFLPFLLAAEVAPHLPRIADHAAPARRLAWSGLVLVSLCWFAYFVALPVAIAREVPIPLPTTGPMFVIFDLMIVVRYLTLAIGSHSPRWTTLYASIAAAMSAMLVIDVLDTMVATRSIHLTEGGWNDLIWGAPPFCLVIAFRLRHLCWRSVEHSAAQGEFSHDRRPASVAFGLVALAGGFPLVHFALRGIGILAPSVEPAQQVMALSAMVLVGAMAISMYRKLDKAREAAAHVRTALERRLFEAKKMEALGRLSSVVTHEFLNLLNAIGGYIDLTLDDLGTDHADSDNLRRAHDVVRRTTGFTTRLLILSRGQPFHPTSVVLNHAVRNLMPQVRALVKSPAVVEEAIDSDEGRVAISADALSEVLVSLATNAGEAMEHGGRLSIETGWIELGPQEAMERAVRPGRYGKVVVGDTGAGMPKEVLAHVFEPFFTTKPKPRNRGLGLATAYVIVNQHGGSVAVTSDVGVGTTVEFLVPVAPANEPLQKNENGTRR